GGVQARQAGGGRRKAGGAGGGGGHGARAEHPPPATGGVEVGGLLLRAVADVGVPRPACGRLLFPAAAAGCCREFAAQARSLGAGVIGGCCGTTPAQIAAIRAAIDENRPPSQPLRVDERRLTIVRSEEQHETEFARLLREGEFVVSIQLEPPLGGD